MFTLTDSIKDWLKKSSNPNFILIVGPARSGKSTLSNIYGEKLLEILENCIPIIQSLNELDNPDIILDIIVEKNIKKYFQHPFDFALNLIPQMAKETIVNKSVEELINLSKTNYIEPIENTVLEIFYQKANEEFENITDLFPDKYNNYKKEF